MISNGSLSLSLSFPPPFISSKIYSTYEGGQLLYLTATIIAEYLTSYSTAMTSSIHKTRVMSQWFPDAIEVGQNIVHGEHVPQVGTLCIQTNSINQSRSWGKTRERKNIFMLCFYCSFLVSSDWNITCKWVLLIQFNWFIWKNIIKKKTQIQNCTKRLWIRH